MIDPHLCTHSQPAASLHLPRGQLRWRGCNSERLDVPSSEARPPREPTSLQTTHEQSFWITAKAMPGQGPLTPRSPKLASLMSSWFLMGTNRLPGTSIFTTHNVAQSPIDILPLLGFQGNRARKLAQGLILMHQGTGLPVICRKQLLSPDGFVDK